MSKRVTTFNVEENIIHLLEQLGVNRSDLVNRLLSEYLSMSKSKQVNQKIDELETQLSALKQRKYELDQVDLQPGIKKEVTVDVMSHLTKAYSTRRELGVDPAIDEKWIMSQANMQRCHILGREPIEMLSELKLNYQKEQKNKESYI